MSKDRERLKELLKTRSLKIGDFLLASGRRSKYYFDSKLTTLTSEGAHATAKCFLEVVREHGIQADAIGGMTLGADPIVSAVAALSHKPANLYSDLLLHAMGSGLADDVLDNATLTAADPTSPDVIQPGRKARKK